MITNPLSSVYCELSCRLKCPVCAGDWWAAGGRPCSPDEPGRARVCKSLQPICRRFWASDHPRDWCCCNMQSKIPFADASRPPACLQGWWWWEVRYMSGCTAHPPVAAAGGRGPVDGQGWARLYIQSPTSRPHSALGLQQPCVQTAGSPLGVRFPSTGSVCEACGCRGGAGPPDAAHHVPPGVVASPGRRHDAALRNDRFLDSHPACWASLAAHCAAHLPACCACRHCGLGHGVRNRCQ